MWVWKITYCAFKHSYLFFWSNRAFYRSTGQSYNCWLYQRWYIWTHYEKLRGLGYWYIRSVGFVSLIVSNCKKQSCWLKICLNKNDFNSNPVNNVGILPSQIPCRLLETADLEKVRQVMIKTLYCQNIKYHYHRVYQIFSFKCFIWRPLIQKIYDVINCNVKAMVKVSKASVKQNYMYKLEKCFKHIVFISDVQNCAARNARKVWLSLLNNVLIILFRSHTDCLCFLRGRGVILNVSSGIAKIPCPIYTLYAASKVYLVKTFTSLFLEV